MVAPFCLGYFFPLFPIIILSRFANYYNSPFSVIILFYDFPISSVSGPHFHSKLLGFF